MTVNKKFPINTHEQEDLEEALGAVWHCFETGVRRKEAVIPVVTQTVDRDIYPRLLNEGFVEEKGDAVVLTSRGETLAKDITRRHRLAERLLTDVLSLEKSAIDPNACQLEHILSAEVSESICTLLGHPKECPHGSAIPAGLCCQKAEDHVEPIVVPMNRLTAGQEGHIAYLLLQHHPELHKLLSLGVVPGTHVRLHQTFPTYVIDLGESQLALEESIAQNIYVRRG